MHRDWLTSLSLVFALCLTVTFYGCGKESHHDDTPEGSQDSAPAPDPEKAAGDTLGGSISGGSSGVESATGPISTLSDLFAGSDSAPFQTPTPVFHGSFTITLNSFKSLHIQYLFESVPIEIVSTTDPDGPTGPTWIDVTAYAQSSQDILKFANSSIKTYDGSDATLKIGSASFTCSRGFMQNSLVAVRGVCMESMKIRVPSAMAKDLKLFVNGLSLPGSPISFSELWKETEALSDDINAYHKRALFKAFVERAPLRRTLTVKQLVELLFTVQNEGDRLDLVRIFSGHILDPRNSDRVLRAFKENPELGIDAAIALAR